MTLLEQQHIATATESNSQSNHQIISGNNTTTNHHPATTIMQRHCETALLAKLQDMVPIMPRERELSQLEIINYVIDYIRLLKEQIFDFDFVVQDS